MRGFCGNWLQRTTIYWLLLLLPRRIPSAVMFEQRDLIRYLLGPKRTQTSPRVVTTTTTIIGSSKLTRILISIYSSAITDLVIFWKFPTIWQLCYDIRCVHCTCAVMMSIIKGAERHADGSGISGSWRVPLSPSPGSRHEGYPVPPPPPSPTFSCSISSGGSSSIIAVFTETAGKARTSCARAHSLAKM